MKNKKDLKKSLLLSYPRSGNTLMRYFLELVTAQPTEGYGKKSETSGSSRDGLPIAHFCPYIFIDRSLPPILKRHGVDEEVVKKFVSIQDRLILLLRNPVECFVRHFGAKIITDWATDTLTRECGIGHPDHYFNNIKFYDNWGGEKQIFYYEDRITDPTQYWKSMNDFVGGDDKKLEEFMERSAWHLKQSRAYYGAPNAQTNGSEVLSHSLKLNEEQLQQVKEKILFKSNDLGLQENTFLKKYKITTGTL